MSSRQEQKAAAREQRIAAEREDSERAARSRRLRRLAIAAGVVVVAAAVLVGVAGGGDDSGSGGGGAVAGATESRELFDGIAQDGNVLGDPDAPVTLVEYADLQCPFCRDYAVNVLPRIVAEHVRAGDLKLELRLLRFIGPDSDRAARAAQAAAERGRIWDFVDLFYRNQGTENTRYATDDFIRDIAAAAELPAQEIVDAIQSPDTERPITEAENAAKEDGIDSTPSFVVVDADGNEQRLGVSELSYEAFERALEPHLK